MIVIPARSNWVVGSQCKGRALSVCTVDKWLGIHAFATVPHSGFVRKAVHSQVDTPGLEVGGMRGFALVIRATFVCLSGLATIGTAPLHAQHTTIRGTVVDSAGRPIQHADVGIVVHRKLTRTDSEGRFSINKIPAGDVELSVRRLTYEPQRIQLKLTSDVDTLRITLVAHPALLRPIEVAASEMRLRENIEDFYRRLTRGVGQYVSRDDIEKRWGGKPSDMLRNTSGIRFVKVPAGRGVRFPNTSIVRRDCPPMIWIDGQKAPGLEIDEVPLGDVEGMELYNGPATTPMQFSQVTSANTCGTIVIWSRPPQYQKYSRKP